MPDTLLPTPAAAALLGVPEQYFTEAADAAGFAAAVPGSTTQPRQWRRAEVEAFGAGPHGAEMRAAVARDAEVETAVAALGVRFPDWTAAIAPAAHAMFQFNRYVKWATCTPARRKELYSLKGRFLKALYAAGLCVSVAEHVHEADGEDEDGDGPRAFLAFAFRIDGQRFSWHLPKSRVSWPYERTPPDPADATRPAWQPGTGPKPISLGAAEFVAAEALVRFVLAGAAEGEAAERAREKQERAARMRADGLARQAALRGDANPPAGE